MTLYSYYLTHPLDWEYCFMEVDECKKWLEESYKKKEKYNGVIAGGLSETLLSIDEILAQATLEWKIAFSEVQQELRCPPLIFPIPEGVFSGKATFGIVLKRDEDGDTFVYSPVPLAYLD